MMPSKQVSPPCPNPNSKDRENDIYHYHDIKSESQYDQLVDYQLHSPMQPA